ncbi:MAG TPA: hypothetical protein VIJ14_02770, partial [Rhabdochlamydiaceae bacterium]
SNPSNSTANKFLMTILQHQLNPSEQESPADKVIASLLQAYEHMLPLSSSCRSQTSLVRRRHDDDDTDRPEGEKRQRLQSPQAHAQLATSSEATLTTQIEGSSDQQMDLQEELSETLQGIADFAQQFFDPSLNQPDSEKQEYLVESSGSGFVVSNERRFHKINTPFLEFKVKGLYVHSIRELEKTMVFGMERRDEQKWRDFVHYRSVCPHRNDNEIYSNHKIKRINKIEVGRHLQYSYPYFYVTRSDDLEYTFGEADFPVLNPEDITYLFNELRRWTVRRFP